jgi:hypothetical protein
LLAVFSSNNYVFSQNCKYLSLGLVDTYEGGSKEHGKCIAKDVDSYEGKFKSGLP